MGDSSNAPSFRNRPGMLSGHEALWWFKFFGNFRTHSSVTSNRWMSGFGLALVNTKENG